MRRRSRPQRDRPVPNLDNGQLALIAAGAILAYVLLKGQGRQILTDVIPLDEPAALQWAETQGAIFFQ